MIVYEQNGTTVVAKFYQEGKTLKEVWEDSLGNTLTKYVLGTDFSAYYSVETIVNKVLADRKLVGIAKCHPNDEFNLEEGKRLAREDLINRFNLAKIQLKKELLYYIKHQVEIVKNRV